jgi:hypothetical protein
MFIPDGVSTNAAVYFYVPDLTSSSLVANHRPHRFPCIFLWFPILQQTLAKKIRLGLSCSMANIKYTQTAEQKRRQDKKSPSSSASGAKHDATKAANASGKQSQPRNRKRKEGNTSAGAPKPKKHRSSNELAALPPNNTILTLTIPSLQMRKT